MKKAVNMLVALALVVSGGCERQRNASFVPIKYVDSIVVNPHVHEHEVLSFMAGSKPYGDIAIFDTPERCLLLSELFMSVDVADNVDGAALSDWLPDFAGESIASIMDDRYTPYEQYLGGRENELRELAVRGFISAVDTTCSIAAYDAASRSSKPGAKAVILSSPFMAAYGRRDIDTLMKSLGVSILVFSPVTSMLSEAFEMKTGSTNLLVLASDEVISSGAYQSVFEEMRTQRADSLTKCLLVSDAVFGADSNGVRNPVDGFRSLLDSCKSNNLSHVGALLVDDYSVSVPEINEALISIQSSGEEADILRRQVLSKGFRIIDPRMSLVTDCYRTFRNRNLFTHNIAYPVASAYITSPESATFKLMDFDDSLLPDSLHDLLLDMAPKTHSSYVQNQHFAGGD